MGKESKAGFFDIKRNLIGIGVLAVLFIAGYFAFGIDAKDYGDLAEEVFEARLPELPVDVSSRVALLGKGSVVMITNTSEKPIIVTMIASTADNASRKSLDLVLKPNQIESLGWSEGWDFMPGDQFSLAADGYKTAKYSVNTQS